MCVGLSPVTYSLNLVSVVFTVVRELYMYTIDYLTGLHILFYCVLLPTTPDCEEFLRDLESEITVHLAALGSWNRRVPNPMFFSSAVVQL